MTNQLREAGSDVAPTNIPSKSGTLSLPAGTETTVAAVTGGPSEIRALELHVPAGEKVRTGNSRVRIYWDGESTPSVDAPLKFLAGDGAGVYQPQARPLVGGYLAGAGGDGSTFMDFNLYYPMPFHSSARVTLTSDPSASTLTGIGWSLRYQSFSDPAGWWGTFHTTYTSVPKPVAGQDMTFLDVAGSGRVVGTVVNFAQVGGTLEGDPRFYIDNSNTPQVQATGTEEWGLGGDYWNGIIPGSPPIITQGHQTTLALGGYPSGLNNPPGSDIDGAAEYRFMIADSVPFNDHLTFRFQHGGNDNSTDPYRAAVMWYGTPTQTAPLTDEVHVGDPASAAAHGYAAPGAEPATLTAAYGYAVTAPSSTDTGDSTTGATSFTMALNPANVGAFLRRKSDYGLPNQRANVFLDGQFAGTWYSSGSFSGTDANGVPRRWRDEEFPLPASLTEGKSSVHVQLQFAQTTTDKAWSNFDYQMYSFVPRGCTTSLPAGNVGSAYNASLAATGGTPPYAWSISTGALPAGLSLNGSSGAISGSPTGPPGTTSFTATVADRSTSPQSTPQPMSIAVSPPLPTNCTTYSSPATGSHQVCGAILAKYQSLGGPAGFLGNPTTDETGTPDGVGRFNHFSSTDNRSNIDGSIYWTAGTGAGSVHGAIRAKWASLGWERSCLGDPLSDEFAISGGRQSNFQRGVISYSFASARATASCG